MKKIDHLMWTAFSGMFSKLLFF